MSKRTQGKISVNSLEYLETGSNDPRFNLAFEESLLRSLPIDHSGVLLLWQNSPSIIIGRHQCALEVVNTSFVSAKNIPVIRRITGGGAVYHDLGNLNFSFIMSSGAKPDFAFFLAPLVQALGSLGVEAKITGRNDLEAQGKKISGSARIVLDNKVLHHGTLLVNLDLERMAAALRVDEAKFRSKGVASVRARVMNISEMTGVNADLNLLKQAIAKCFKAVSGKPDPQLLQDAHELALGKYSSWDWNYGQSPPFNLEKRARFPWGEISIRLDIRKSRIGACAINGDFFNASPITTLENLFINLPFEPSAIANALAKIHWRDYFVGCDESRMRKFFTIGLFE